ncbi:TonB-dependent siderophore receptor [Methylocella sp.]|uniref:TonB-dependent siderophore receptor n=1 Tax=Methylocella sp. TaxID=1978226 RepID=UPI00378333DE
MTTPSILRLDKALRATSAIIGSLAPLICFGALGATSAFGQDAPDLPPVVVEPMANPDGPPIVQTTAGPVQGYRALTATGATRTETPIQQIPLSIEVIPRSVIDDQDNLSVAETLRNVSATQGTNPLQTPAFTSVYIRGFPAQQWVDGFTNLYGGGDRDSLINVERIEVLKGPNAILYGGGAGAPLGGVVNLVSKLPIDKAFAELGFTFGSYNFVQPYFDVNTPVTKDGTVLFRMTGEYTSSNSFVDVLDLHRYSFNPTLTFTNKSDTTLTIRASFTNWEQQEYQGLPATGTVTGSFRLNPNMYIGPPNMPPSWSRTQSVTAIFDHSFDETWSTNIQARFAHTQFKEMAQSFSAGFDFAGNAPAAAPSYWNLLNIAMHQEETEGEIVANAKAKFKAGPTDNTILFGADFSYLYDNSDMWGNLNDIFTLGYVNLQSPVYPPFTDPVAGPQNANVMIDGHNTYTTAGVYAQIQSTLFERAHFLGSLRLATLQIDNSYPLSMTEQTQDATRLLPQVGLLVDLFGGVSAYASYSQGMKANPWFIYTGAAQPEFSRQAEVGLKFDLGHGFTGSTALFEINHTGVPISVGPVIGGFGQQRSRGVEADLLWQPNRNLQVLGSFAFIDATQVNDVPGVAAAGNRLNIVAPTSGRIWANYTFDPGVLDGWSTGVGMYAASSAYVDPANVYKTPGYVTFDAKLAYETAHFKASVTVKNLAGERFFVPYNYWGGRVAVGEGRGVFGKLSWTFN